MVKNIKKYYLYTVELFLILVLAACAGGYQSGPSGGDDDRIGPAVESLYPQSGAVNQPRDLSLKIDFTEFIKYSTTADAVSISPLSAAANARIDWGERSLEISFNDLAADQTVLTIVGSGLTDLRGNRLKDNFILPFSTGPKLDSAVCSGQVFDAIVNNDIQTLPASAIKIKLYKDQQIADSGYFRANAEYEFGLGERGRFKVGYLNPGLYKALVFHDKNNNGILDLSGDELFTAGEQNIVLDSLQEFHGDFVPGLVDTLPPYIKDVEILAADLLSVQFSEPVQTVGLTVDSLLSADIFLCRQLYAGSDITDRVTLLTDSLHKNKELELVLESFKDAYNNPSKSLGQRKRFFTPDSLPVIKPGLYGALSTTLSADDTLKIMVNRPELSDLKILLAESREKAAYQDYSDKLAKKPFVYQLPWQDTSLPTGDYRILVKSAEDTLYLNKIKIMPKGGQGSLSGKIEKPDSAACNIIIKPLKNGEKTRVLKTSASAYKVSLNPGFYKVAAYLDLNRDNQYNPGAVNPDMLSEPAVMVTDTLQIRKNWEQGDYHFKFKKLK